MRALRGASVLGAAMLVACSSTPGATPAPIDDGSPPFDQTWQIATHNSYWIDRGTPGDLLASGVQERLLDQLVYDHTRTIEIDVHKDPDHPGAFRVYHTAAGNSLCDPLDACLAEIRTFHYALPRHEAITIVIELKELFESNFDATHAVEDLDAVLADGLGALLYRPGDLLARCRGHERTSLGACAAAHGFPGIATLRGRVLVATLGNWDKLGGRATADWVAYAVHGPIGDRAAFPMASSWKLDPSMLTADEQSLIDPADLSSAVANAALLQIEALDDPAGPAWLARRGVVRVDGAGSIDDQRLRHVAGFQLLQTDTPWIQDADDGPRSPLRAFDPAVARDWLREPGRRFRLQAASADTRVFAHVKTPAPSTRRYETLVSGGEDAARVGCLRVASSNAGDAASYTVCRSKRPAVRDASSAGSGPADAEAPELDVTTCRDATCDAVTHIGTDAPGELIALDVRIDGKGRTCAQASAASVDASLEAVFADLGAEQCFDSALIDQGLFLPAGSPDVLFAGTRVDAGDGFTQLGATDLSVVVDDAGVATVDPARLTDLSGP